MPELVYGPITLSGQCVTGGPVNDGNLFVANSGAQAATVNWGYEAVSPNGATTFNDAGGARLTSDQPPIDLFGADSGLGGRFEGQILIDVKQTFTLSITFHVLDGLSDCEIIGTAVPATG